MLEFEEFFLQFDHVMDEEKPTDHNVNCAMVVKYQERARALFGFCYPRDPFCRTC